MDRILRFLLGMSLFFSLNLAHASDNRLLDYGYPPYPVRPDDPSYPPYPVRPDDPGYPPSPVRPDDPGYPPYPVRPDDPNQLPVGEIGRWVWIAGQSLVPYRWQRVGGRIPVTHQDCVQAIRVNVLSFFAPYSAVYVGRAFIQDDRGMVYHQIMGLTGANLPLGQFVFPVAPYGGCVRGSRLNVFLDTYTQESGLNLIVEALVYP